MKMKSILVPTDFSESAASAYNYASLLAEKTKATIFLLHVLDIPFPSQSVSGSEVGTRLDTHFMMEMMNLTKTKMKKLRNGKNFKDAEIHEIIEIGSIPDKIFEATKKYKVNMIVMGTHGSRGFQDKFLGTNAEKVVRNAEVPVISVKHPVKNPKIENIVFATDFSKETEYILPQVSEIAGLFKSKLILTKIVTPDKFETTAQTEKQIELLKRKMEFNNFSTNIYYATSKEGGIRTVAEKTGADLIAMGTHGRHGLAHLFKGSIAEEVVCHASLPVLTMNFHRKMLSSPTIVQGKKTRQYDSDLLYQIPSV
jgi:nucleotide-binding universal stress UspA family protein